MNAPVTHEQLRISTEIDLTTGRFNGHRRVVGTTEGSELDRVKLLGLLIQFVLAIRGGHGIGIEESAQKSEEFRALLQEHAKVGVGIIDWVFHLIPLMLDDVADDSESRILINAQLPEWWLDWAFQNFEAGEEEEFEDGEDETIVRRLQVVPAIEGSDEDCEGDDEDDDDEDDDDEDNSEDDGAEELAAAQAERIARERQAAMTRQQSKNVRPFNLVDGYGRPLIR